MGLKRNYLYLLFGIILIGLGGMLVGLLIDQYYIVNQMAVVTSSTVILSYSLKKDKNYIKMYSYLLYGVILILLISFMENLWLARYGRIIFILLILIYPLGLNYYFKRK